MSDLINTVALARCKKRPMPKELFQQFVCSPEAVETAKGLARPWFHRAKATVLTT